MVGTRRISGVATCALAGVMFGCSTTQYAGRIVTPDKEAEIRGHLPFARLVVNVDRGDVANARRGDAGVFTGEIVHVDGTNAQIALVDRNVQVPNANIRQIQVSSRVLGALEGLGWGVFVGGAGGAAAAAIGCPWGRMGASK